MQRVSVGGTKGGIVTKGGPGEYGGEDRKILVGFCTCRDMPVYVHLTNVLAVLWPVPPMHGGLRDSVIDGSIYIVHGLTWMCMLHPASHPQKHHWVLLHLLCAWWQPPALTRWLPDQSVTELQSHCQGCRHACIALLWQQCNWH
jgi:hypothetical protein